MRQLSVWTCDSVTCYVSSSPLLLFWGWRVGGGGGGHCFCCCSLLSFLRVSTHCLILASLCSMVVFSHSNRPRLIYQYANKAPRLSGQNCNLFKVLLFLDSWKLWSHVRIMIYQTWPIGQGRFFSSYPATSFVWSNYPINFLCAFLS